MELISFTREELAEYILRKAKDETIAKFNAILKEQIDEEIVAYTADGLALTAKEYSAHLDAIGKKMEEGEKTYTTEEVRSIVLKKN